MKANVFGIRLRELRLERGLTQRQLAELLGYCNQTVSFWEIGKREPDLDALKKTAEFFEVTADYLIGID